MQANRLLTFWVTSGFDGRDHAITDDDIEAARAAGQIIYRAVCGHDVVMCSILTPLGPRCLGCLDRLAAPRKRRPWWLPW